MPISEDSSLRLKVSLVLTKCGSGKRKRAIKSGNVMVFNFLHPLCTHSIPTATSHEEIYIENSSPPNSPTQNKSMPGAIINNPRQDGAAGSFDHLFLFSH